MNRQKLRHAPNSGEFGYGHVMFLRLRNLVQPVSRGMLVDSLDPDYPPLCFACDDAREQGGLVLWCHNGQGMEAPVAAALGKLDGFNLFDPFWRAKLHPFERQELRQVLTSINDQSADLLSNGTAVEGKIQ